MDNGTQVRVKHSGNLHTRQLGKKGLMLNYSSYMQVLCIYACAGVGAAP